MKQTVQLTSPNLDAPADEAGLYHEIHETELQAKLVNPEPSYALAQWLLQAKAGAIPEEAAFLKPHLAWIEPSTMLLRPEPSGDFVYAHYGARVAAQAGFTMQGRRVSEFQGALGRFFRRIYADVMERPRPVATVHRLGNFRERPMWERLILPLAAEGRISALYVVNTIRDLAREFEAFSARSRGNGLIALQFVRSAAMEIVDVVIVGANLRAREMTERRLDELLHRPMVECFPGVVAAGLWDRYMTVAETREPQRLVLDYDSDGVRGSFDVVIAPFLDGVSIDFAPCVRV